jgi:tetratricopeptide (TPR) repeat protein
VNKKQSKVIAFIEALHAFHTDFRKTKKYLKDNRLTQVEKKILECWLMLRDRDLNEILAVIPNLVVDYDDLVSSQRNLIWGLAYNNRNEYNKALPLVQKALQEIMPYEVPRLEFNVVNTLFIVYLNLKDEHGMKSSLDHLEKISPENVKQEICLLQCQYSYNAFIGRMNEAGKILDMIEHLSLEMSEIQLIAHQINRFMFYAKLEDFNGCESALKNMKRFRKFQASANFIYMRLFLDHLYKNKPIYVYPRDFDGHPFLFYQIKVIQSFEAADLKEAMKYWKLLTELAPHTFKDHFEYLGDKCVFSLALDKYRSKLEQNTGPTDIDGNKEEVLLSILKNSKLPVRKDDLYKKIWGIELVDKADAAKLQKLVSRVRQKFGVDIQFKKECYQLIAAKKSA